MKTHVTLVTIFLCAAMLRAQAPFIHTNTMVDAPGSEPREHPLDVERLTLRVRFDPPKGIVYGTVTHVFRVLQPSVDSVEFDAIKIRISSAKLGTTSVRYRSTDTSVIAYFSPALRWDTYDSLTIVYEATPRKGIYFIGWNDPSSRMRKQIWTQGQGIDNRHWIPMYDEMNDKMITETITTFDGTYEVLSNGTRLGVATNSDGTKTWHYRMTRPHASYLLMLAIGNYTITERRSASGVPIYLYSYPDFPERIDPTYMYSVESMDFLESEIGVPYPWESYSQVPVADYIFGAMENTTATIFGDFSQTDKRSWLDRSYVGTNVHELTHQWFGDLVTARSQKSVWLQESFATFYPHLFTRRQLALGGEDGYQWSRRGMHRSALAAAEKDRLPIVHPSSGSARIYPKGACVLDMMNYVFGDSAVRRVIRHYTMNHMYQNVETNDLYQSFQDTLGLAPEWFFDQWLYKGGEPHYKVSHSPSSAMIDGSSTPTTLVTIEQIHQTDALTGLFRMPIDVGVYYADGTTSRVRSDVSKQVTSVNVPNPGKKTVSFVLFDPGSYVLKKVTFDKTWEERRAQLTRAANMIDRYDALESMRSDGDRAKERIALLSDVMAKESFHAMRSEAVQQAAELALNGTADAWAIVSKGLSDRSADVRKAAINAIVTVPADLRDQVEQMLTDSSYQIIQTALTKLARSFPKDVRRFTSRVSTVRGMHERVRIARLELEAEGGSQSALDELADLCGPGWEFITRQNAMGAFRRLGTITPLSASHMIAAILGTNNRLSGVAGGIVGALCEQPRLKAVFRQVVTGKELESSQKDLLSSVLR
ncbi:MAG: M1 family aminopeptidase [Candidatus Kapaibacterium sp.]